MTQNPPQGQAPKKSWLSVNALRRLFLWSLLLKGLDGVMELVGGIVLACVSRAAMINIVYAMTRGELSEDPHDFVATHLTTMASNLSGDSKNFAAYYLIGHGVLKLFLVICLLRNYRWAYPVGIFIMLGFIGYEGFRLSARPSILLGLLTAFDVAVVLIIYLEYRQVKSGQERPNLWGKMAPT